MSDNVLGSYTTNREPPQEKTAVFQRLTLLWKRFSPLEEQLLAVVRSVLPHEAQTIFDAQLASFNKVQRLPPSWNDISFYRIKWGKADWNGFPRFPCTDEFRLAEIRFCVSGKQYRATLTSIDGHIFSFTITPSPKAIAFARWEGKCQTKLLADPMRAPTGGREPEQIPVAWRRVVDRHRDSNLRWYFHDETTAYRVTLDDGEYLVLAELEGQEYVLQRTEPPSEQFFLLRDYSGVPIPIEGDVETVVELR